MGVGGAAAARGLRRESGAGLGRQLLKLRPYPAPTPAPSSGLGTGPQTENCNSPGIAHLSKTPGPPWSSFSATATPQPKTSGQGVSNLPPFLHVAAAPSRREPQGDTFFGTTDPRSAPALSGPASRQSPVASPGSGTRCRRPAPADPPPSLCLRRPTARPAPPSPGSPRAAPRGGHSRRWAGRMPPGWSRRTPWLQ